MISLTSYGGCDGVVTGSRHILRIDNEKYMADCGAFMGSQDLERKNREIKLDTDIDGVLLTHAHSDHCGNLPLLTKSGYSGKIYCTPATRDLASIIMMDSAKINAGLEPLYTENDVIGCLDHFRAHAYGKHKILSDKMSFTQYNAGHILGSSMFSVECSPKRTLLDRLRKKEKKINILFTGDLGRENNPIVNPPEIKIPAPDYIVLESTYGNRLHESVPYSMKEMKDIICSTVARGGKVIIPAFAVERAQELIYYLKTLMSRNLVPRVPVYLDSPMAAAATGVFSIHPECYNRNIKDQFISRGKNPFSVSSLKIVKDNTESLKIARSRKPCIVIAASGMMDAGRILNHLHYGIENPRNSIMAVGYMAEGTTGRDIVSGKSHVMVDGKMRAVNAEVRQIGAFSGHADWREELFWLSKIDTSKLKKILIVHGDKDAQESLKAKLESIGYTAEIMREGKEYRI